MAIINSKFNIRPIKTVDGLTLPQVVRQTPDLADNFPNPAEGYSKIRSGVRRAHGASKLTRLSIESEGEKSPLEAYVPKIDGEVAGMGTVYNMGEVAVLGCLETPDTPEFVDGHNFAEWLGSASRGYGFGHKLLEFLVDRAQALDKPKGKTTWTLIHPGDYDEWLFRERGAKLAGGPADYSEVDDVSAARQILYIPR